MNAFPFCFTVMILYFFDYRSLNGGNVDTKFGDFFEETGKYFYEELLQVNERRRGKEFNGYFYRRVERYDFFTIAR